MVGAFGNMFQRKEEEYDWGKGGIVSNGRRNLK